MARKRKQKSNKPKKSQKSARPKKKTNSFLAQKVLHNVCGQFDAFCPHAEGARVVNRKGAKLTVAITTRFVQTLSTGTAGNLIMAWSPGPDTKNRLNATTVVDPAAYTFAAAYTASDPFASYSSFSEACVVSAGLRLSGLYAATETKPYVQMFDLEDGTSVPSSTVDFTDLDYAQTALGGVLDNEPFTWFWKPRNAADFDLQAISTSGAGNTGSAVMFWLSGTASTNYAIVECVTHWEATVAIDELRQSVGRTPRLNPQERNMTSIVKDAAVEELQSLYHTGKDNVGRYIVKQVGNLVRRAFPMLSYAGDAAMMIMDVD